MTTSRQQPGQCRIVVGLKTASDVESPVSAAAILASALQAEVVGLYIEEDAMMDLAGLPFACALSAGASRPQALTPELMKQAISRGAVTCRQTLSARAETSQVKWSFSCKRGDAFETIQASLATGDFLVVPSQRRGFDAHDVMDELRSIPRHARGVVVAGKQQGARPKGPVIAIDDGDAAGNSTVLLAARIAKATRARLMLFAIASNDREADRIIHRAHETIGPAAELEVHRFFPGATRSMLAGLMHVTPSFVVADLEGEPFSDDAAALSLFRAANAPVVLVKPVNTGTIQD